MQALVILGSALVLGALAALGYCILRAFRLRSTPDDENAMRRQFQRLAAINLAALCTAGLGLACLAVGLIL